MYRSKVELTGEKIRIVRDFDLMARPLDQIGYDIVDEVAIKMPKYEYEKFMLHWKHYINLLHKTKDNPFIEKELHKLLMMVELLN
jgi:hypothetical protein